MVSLAKPVEEIYPQSPIQAVKEKAKSLVIEVERPPQNPPAVAQPTMKYKRATLTTYPHGKIHREVRDIPLNDLTALSEDELKALTKTSVQEIADAFALIQRVAAEGERRAELNGNEGGDHAFSSVCEFHTGIFPKMAAYNKRHKKMHPWIYSKFDNGAFWVTISVGGVGVVGAFIALLCRTLGLL